MRVARWGATEIIFNDYFILLLGLYFLLGVLPQALLLFTAVALHEGCHAIVAYRLGWRVSSVELFPFGGVARLQRPTGRQPWSEALIALAGPAASLGMALILVFVCQALKPAPSWLLFFARVNLILGLFNLWPGLPLDGGRLYRAWRSQQCGWAQATLEGVYGGWLLAITLGLTSCLGYYLRMVDLQGLVLALFIYYAAQGEREAVPYMFWQDFWQRRNRNKFLMTGKARWLVAEHNLPSTRLVRHFAAHAYNLVAVIDTEGRLAGILTETEIMGAIMAGRTGLTLKEILANKL
ncbi:MAG: hypothetical protein GX039_07220 [Clostridia bacterium]|nr:hypothetical protein [Clostridia bacterium]